MRMWRPAYTTEVEAVLVDIGHRREVCRITGEPAPEPLIVGYLK